MATQILRTVDRWRFETPLALVLAAATGFAGMAMPRALFARLPGVGHFGMAGQILLASLLAIVCGVLAYRAMRRPATPVPVDEDAELIDDIDTPSGLSEDRLHRLRRADRHPDAPPRAPIRASRDLGEPFMEVGAFVAPSAVEAEPAEPIAAEPAIIEGDFVEVEASVAQTVDGDPAPGLAADVAPVAEAIIPATPDPVSAPDEAAAPRPAPFAPRAAGPAPRQDDSIAAMMERLSAGMERRAGRPAAPMRDMRPALRDALDELNRLAAHRG